MEQQALSGLDIAPRDSHGTPLERGVATWRSLLQTVGGEKIPILGLPFAQDLLSRGINYEISIALVIHSFDPIRMLDPLLGFKRLECSAHPINYTFQTDLNGENLQEK